MKVDINYADLKSLIASKNLGWQYVEFDANYDVFAVDAGIMYQTMLYKVGFEPKNCATCTADTTDFETNYKSGANEPVIEESLRNKKLIYGKTTVTTAGTRVILMVANTKSNTIIIKASPDNMGNIYVGDNLVTSANGFRLEAGSTLSLPHDHSKDNLYIDADNSGEGVDYIGGGR